MRGRGGTWIVALGAIVWGGCRGATDPTSPPPADSAEVAAPTDDAGGALDLGPPVVEAATNETDAATSAARWSPPPAPCDVETDAGLCYALTGHQIEPVVRAHAREVRRTCWEKGRSTATSANETVSLEVDGKGRVTKAAAEGNDPDVGKCIERACSTWTFPATGAKTELNIPFHFVHDDRPLPSFPLHVPPEELRPR